MRRFRDLAINRKLTLVMMSISSATVLLAGITAIIYEVAAFRTVAVRDLSVQAEIVGENCAAALAFDDPRTARETLASLRPRTVTMGKLAGVTGLEPTASATPAWLKSRHGHKNLSHLT